MHCTSTTILTKIDEIMRHMYLKRKNNLDFFILNGGKLFTESTYIMKMFSFHSMVDGFEAEVCFILLVNVTQGVRNIELKTL